jgi:alanyl-tRNA synthetase
MGFQIGEDRVHLDLNREEAIRPDQIREIERTANLIALKQLPIKTSFTTRDAAVERFGSELGLTEVTPTGEVRLVEVGDEDVSLCCGTHVRSTVEVLPIKILGRLRLQKGIERLEVAASECGYAKFSEASDVISKLIDLLDSEPKDIVSRTRQILEERDKMKDEMRKLRMSVAESEAMHYLAEAEVVKPLKVVAKALKDADADTLKRMALKITYSDQDAVVVLGSSDGTTHLVAAAGMNLVKRGLNIGAIVRNAAAQAGCRGGGASNIGQTGGFNRDRLRELIEEIRGTIIDNVSRMS